MLIWKDPQLESLHTDATDRAGHVLFGSAYGHDCHFQNRIKQLVTIVQADLIVKCAPSHQFSL